MGLFHKDLRKELELIIASLKRNTVRMPADWQWVKRRKHELHDIEKEDLQLMAYIRQLHAKHLDNPKLSHLLFIKARQLHEYIRQLFEQQGQLDPKKFKTEIALVNAVVKEIGAIYDKEVAYEKAYERFVVSTPNFIRFLHRTALDTVGNIMELGLVCGNNLLSTSTIQPVDMDSARKSYEMRHKGDQAVIIIEIPRNLWALARKRQGSGHEAMDNSIGYMHPKARDFAIKPQFIVGFIDRRDNRVHISPRYKKLGIALPKPGFLGV
jgi:hypothetical protein